MRDSDLYMIVNDYFDDRDFDVDEYEREEELDADVLREDRALYDDI